MTYPEILNDQSLQYGLYSFIKDPCSYTVMFSQLALWNFLWERKLKFVCDLVCSIHGSLFVIMRVCIIRKWFFCFCWSTDIGRPFHLHKVKDWCHAWTKQNYTGAQVVWLTFQISSYTFHPSVVTKHYYKIVMTFNKPSVSAVINHTTITF